METLEKQPYGEILFDKSKFFHGVGSDLLRMISILQNGILSKDEAENTRVKITRNNSHGYNLTDSISVAESPSIHNTFTSECFDLYIRHGISFVIADEITYKAERDSNRDSKFKDEAFVKGKIEKDHIVGIMIPEDLLNSPIIYTRPGLVAKDDEGVYSNIRERCLHTIEKLELETGYHSNTLIINELLTEIREIELKADEYIEIMRGSTKNDDGKFEEAHSNFYKNNSKAVRIARKIEEELGNLINEAFKRKFGKEDVTVKDVLKNYIPSTVKVYNSQGFEIKL